MADTGLLQGEVNGNPDAEVRDIEALLAGFLRSLLDEQREVHNLGPSLNTATLSTAAIPAAISTPSKERQ